MQKSALVMTMLVAGLLFMQFAWRTPSVNQCDKPDFARKVNLALRRTAHHLLLEKGDSTSQIQAVQRPAATTYQIRLERPFEYGRLPILLHQSLAIYAVKDNYEVALLDCANGELQLGYNLLDVTEKNNVPCAGREQERGCYVLQLSFTAQATNALPVKPVWWAWIMSCLLIGGAYIVWQKAAKKRTSPSVSAPSIHTPASIISIGQLSFSPANQAVSIAGVTYPLTYREAKLLHLFVCHPNELLTRDFILKTVWEDEGIFVSRSADVFVSRLRKLLRPDPALRLVAVHGVGYRLEVTA